MAAPSALGTTYSSGISWNGRTSTGAPQAADPLPAHLRAASRSGALVIQKPPSCSLVSANGPSVVTTSPSCTRTTVAVLGGVEHVDVLVGLLHLLGRGADSLSTICTASSYCFTGCSFRPGR